MEGGLIGFCLCGTDLRFWEIFMIRSGLECKLN